MPTLIRSVVAASDFSFSAHRAARRAGTLAKEHGASLHLLHVLDGSTAKALLRRSPVVDVAQSLRVEAERALESLATDVVASGGIVTERLLREGRVLDEILAVGASCDLLVLGPRGVNPLRDFILGSTAERIARMIDCAMLVAKQDPQINYENVLVPVDFSDYSMPALQFAIRLAPQATLHLFHSVDFPLKGRMRNAGITDEEIDAYCADLLQQANTSMTELTEGLQAHRVTSTVLAGDARLNISAHADVSGCTLIVMGKQGRSWLSEHIIGSVTRSVLERASCDVVVVPKT